MIRRAILSVSDKRGIIELARFLTARGVEILSTGGTAKHLAEASITVTPISAWSGAPEILGGRVKTLTPKVFGAILYDRSRSDHVTDCETNQIPPVDLVVVNLYPFESTIVRQGVSLAEAIEQIDVGGPSMLRAAAKNHAHVIPLCSPDLYEEFMREVESGAVSEDFRRRAALEVFHLTARYDRAIATYLETRQPGTGNPEPGTLPTSLHLELSREQSLRYGENPQQKAAFYRHAGQRAGSFRQLQGKDLSYNNLIDLDAAWKLAMTFEAPACAIIKHTNPCGVATGASTDDAFGAAIASDPVSAFGGVVGVNGAFTAEAARLVESLFFELIVAPGFSPEAQDLLAKKKNLRLIETAGHPPVTLELRSAAGGILAQTADQLAPFGDWKCVTKRQPTAAERKALEFAWIVCAHVKSNAIVLANQRQSIGIGAGQMSRVDSARIAVMKSVLPLAGAVAASDAFFPFRDGLDILSDAGVRAVVQPGGSVRDEQVVAAADERNVAMLFTGERHFRH